MEEPVLVEIMRSVVETNGIYPEKYALILEELRDIAVIWKMRRDNGLITAELSPAHQCYHQLHKRISTGSFVPRAFWKILYTILKHEDLARLRESIAKVEKIRDKYL